MSNKVHFSWSVTHKKPSHPVTQFITKWHFCHSFCIFMPTDTEAATWCFFFWNKNQHMSSDPDRAIEQLCKKKWKSWLTVWRAYSAFFRYSWHWPCRTMALWWMALRLEPLQGAAEGTHHHFIIKQPHYHSLQTCRPLWHVAHVNELWAVSPNSDVLFPNGFIQIFFADCVSQKAEFGQNKIK